MLIAFIGFPWLVVTNYFVDLYTLLQSLAAKTWSFATEYVFQLSEILDLITA